jgi:peptide/nickel transport system substrate-binding protein
MKIKLAMRTIVATAAIAGLAAMGLSPATAATRTTVTLVSSNAVSSLNPSTPETNLTINNDVKYVTSMGFNYYDNSRALKKNTTFGSYKITKNTSGNFQVTYTVNKGKVYSDGTEITGVNLLLSHILNSSAYSKKAKLGDPADSEKTPAFNSLGYGGIYDENVVGLPKLSADGYSVTITYKKFLPDWEIIGPGPAPVHALVQMAQGKTKLGTPAQGKKDAATFLKWFNGYDAVNLAKVAKIWSEDYNIKTVNGSTNPLLLVDNGAYKIKSAVADQNVTLVLNTKYNSGPKTSGIKTIVFRMIADGTAAAQALANREIDIYQGQATADAVAQLTAMKGVTVIGGTNACYEHMDLRIGAGAGEATEYTGVFASSNNAAKNAKARDLREAFLLAVPRQSIVDKLIKPINSKAVLVGSTFLLPGQNGYDTVVKSSGAAKYIAGTEATRLAASLKLVQKYFPNAADGSKSVKVNLLWGAPSNQRRAAQAQLIVAAAAKAGFEVVAPGVAAWSGQLASNDYDAAFFAWCPTSVSQTGTNANFQSDGANNFIGYNNPVLDSILKKLEGKLTPAGITAQILAAEKLIQKDAVSLAIFQHPAATAHNSTLKNVKPAPLSPNLVWNFWEWKY